VIQRVEAGREVEVVLGLEVAIDRALPDPGVRRDVVDQDLVEGTQREDPRGGLEDRGFLDGGLGSGHVGMN